MSHLLWVYYVPFFELARVAVIVWVFSEVVVGAADLCFNSLLQILQALLTVAADLVDPLLRDQMLMRLGQCRPINAIVFE
jgi:hypothetical protein